MRQIRIYDTEAEIIEDLAINNATTVAEVVEAFMEFLEEVKENNGWE